MDERKKTRFFWGVLLAWVPTIPLALAFVHIPRDIPTSKAIGLGAVAGMLAEAYLTLGIGLTLVFEVAAIILLLRAFSREHVMRSLFSIVSICCSALIVFFFGLFIWFFVFKMARTG
jgi:hypothetical protein